MKAFTKANEAYWRDDAEEAVAQAALAAREADAESEEGRSLWALARLVEGRSQVARTKLELVESLIPRDQLETERPSPATLVKAREYAGEVRD
jgi:hypothetical protein